MSTARGGPGGPPAVRGAGQALGHDEARTELIEWFGGGPGVLLLTGPVRAAKESLLDELTRWAGSRVRWLRVTPDERVLASAGAPEELLEALVRQATAFYPVADAGEPPGLVVIDDLEGVQTGGGRLAGMLGTLVTAALREGWDGPRIVAGVASVPPPLEGLATIEPAHVHARGRAVEELAAWAGDRDAPPVLLVRGRPGAGKTFLLRQAVHRLASVPGVRPAYAALRDGAARDASPPLRTPGVVAAFIEAFREQGLVFGAPADGTLIVDVDVGTMHPGARVTGIGRVEVASSLHTYGNLAVALEQRSAGGWADTTLVLVVDGLNELEGELPEELSALRTFLQHRHDFPAWNLKVVLSSQYVPDWLRARVLDLDDHRGDVREFAGTVLSGLGIDDAEPVAEQVARLADGLFIVAGGYLAELAGDPALAGRLAAETPAGGAAGYFVRALDRVAESCRGTSREQDWIDFERLLTIAAIASPGLTAEEMRAVWEAPLEDRLAPPTSRDWAFAAARGAGSVAREYLRFPAEAGGRYRVFHSTLREAVGRRTGIHEGLTPVAERRRFLRALTPLHPGGRPWDPRDGRLALSEVLTVIGDLLGSGDTAVVAEAEEALKLLLETWTWLETCVAGAEPPSPDGLALGVGVVLAGLDRLSRVTGYDAAALALWDGDPETPRALPVAQPKPAPAAQKRRGRGLAYPDRDAELRKVLAGRSVHGRRADAERVVDGFKQRYQFSAKAVDERSPDRKAMWIKDFEVTLKERDRGFSGNLAWIDVRRVSKSSWKVQATKVEAPIEWHPATPKVRHDQPNWSVYPLPVTDSGIKRVRRTVRAFHTRSDAERVLRDFIAEYPKVGSPQGQGYKIIVYEGPHRMRKILLTVVQRPDGRYVIRAEPNLYGADQPPSGQHSSGQGSFDENASEQNASERNASEQNGEPA